MVCNDVRRSGKGRKRVGKVLSLYRRSEERAPSD
nr:MAG TPA: hypothetical protein [Caudoviricetes sp.]